jgi:S-adenosylmethionine-diacylgycerolhomoserine-N-methlytransferase
MSERADNALAGYYRLHASIYDLTRPLFLFGRQQLVREAVARTQPKNVLEIGCGTGWLLAECARRAPGARLTGVDLSPDMLKRAQKRLGTRATLIQQRYAAPLEPGGFDLIILSYMLTMTGPHFRDILATAGLDLSPSGAIAIVDFDSTPLPWFARWMRLNHVEMQGQIKREIDANFEPLWLQQRSCYFGVWQRLAAVLRPRQV